MDKQESPLDNSPIMKSALQTVPREHGRPAMPAIEREMHKATPNDGDTIILWSGVWRRGGTSTGWTTWDKPDDPEIGHAVTRVSAATVERMLSPLAHEARIRIMQAMHDGPKPAGDLSKATGLRGGNLYYHLRELIHAAYVSENDGAYDLTGLGCQLLLTVTHIARGVEGRLDEGLPIRSTQG